MPSFLDNALRSASTSTETTQKPLRCAFAIGTVGRLGEELLNCLLESSHYTTVNVAVEAPMRSMLERLQPWLLEATASDEQLAGASMPSVDDVFCCLADARSYFKRDQAYVMLRKEHIAPIARAAARGGAKRLIVIAPLSAFLQLTAPVSGLLDLLEHELVALGFEMLVLVRPAADYIEAQGNAIERLIAWGAKAIMQIMIPSRLQPLRARQIANAAVNAAHLLGPGIHIIGAQEIAALATPGVPVPTKRRRL